MTLKITEAQAEQIYIDGMAASRIPVPELPEVVLVDYDRFRAKICLHELFLSRGFSIADVQDYTVALDRALAASLEISNLFQARVVDMTSISREQCISIIMAAAQ